MLNNPFTPLFGGKPTSFFGREELLKRFDRSLQVPGSDDRVLFITGTRGSGKTALLEQFSQRATKKGWRAIDIGAERALPTLFRNLRHFDDETITINPSIEVKVFGTGGGVSGRSSAKTTHLEIDDLPLLLQEECKAEDEGLFVSIDEIQKVPLDDMARICEAFQMASRKGYEIALAIAGLPYSHENIIHQDGCTFMRRSVHENLNLLSAQEVQEAFSRTFSKITGLSMTEDALNLLTENSSGHPYMMQLLGYHIVEALSRTNETGSVKATKDVAETIIPIARSAYERRSLEPLIGELSDLERNYLRAMAETANGDYVSRTSDIAKAMGKTPQQIGPSRKKLINHGIIVPVKHGTQRFNVPYLRAYMLKPNQTQANLRQLESWGV